MVQEDLDEDTVEIFKQLKKYVNTMKDCVEDLGSKVVESMKLDFKNKIHVEEFVREMVEVIDIFDDSLVAMTRIIDFEENRINVKMTLARLKNMRQSLVEKMNKMSKFSVGLDLDDDQAKLMEVTVSDVIDSILKESYQLQIQKLSEVLNRKF
jgi:NurA-like 5'-3' nuclease